MTYTQTEYLAASPHPEAMTMLSGTEATAPGKCSIAGSSCQLGASAWSAVSQEAVRRIVSQGAATAVAGTDGIGELSRLLQLQTEVQRYQLRVEVVTKVAECAVASIRKLQQQ